MAASQLDSPCRKFGLRALDTRNVEGAPSFECWWPEREPLVPTVPAAELADPDLKEEFTWTLHEHRLREREKAHLRARLRRKQLLELSNERKALMRRRKEEAQLLPPMERRTFYSAFSKDVRAPQLAAVRARYRHEAAELRRARMPTWTEFVAERTSKLAPTLGDQGARLWRITPAAVDQNEQAQSSTPEVALAGEEHFTQVADLQTLAAPAGTDAEHSLEEFAAFQERQRSRGK